jgi:hypothetical protein
MYSLTYTSWLQDPKHGPQLPREPFQHLPEGRQRQEVGQVWCGEPWHGHSSNRSGTRGKPCSLRCIGWHVSERRLNLRVARVQDLPERVRNLCTWNTREFNLDYLPLTFNCFSMSSSFSLYLGVKALKAVAFQIEMYKY